MSFINFYEFFFQMSRKITACGHLYVAPVGLDFSVPSHTARRWQRRFFTLYDDGELSFALDDNVSSFFLQNFKFQFCNFPAGNYTSTDIRFE